MLGGFVARPGTSCSPSYADRVAHGTIDRTRWGQDVVLTDGSTVHVRPIEPDDGEALLAFHGRQSRESVYFRYFSPRPHLSDEDIRHLTHVDGIDRMAFVAERDDELLGVARYDRYPDRPVAEVAFFTDDRMSGKGIATVLLEYLAAYGREIGISRFEATVLPSNRRMVRVFQAAGYGASSAYADGVIEVTFDIDPSEEAAQAMAERARRAERQSVVRLLEPRSVAVVGAGRNPASVGHRVLHNLLAGPFHGTVYPVHPEAHAVAGVKAYRGIAEVPDEIDVAVVCVPAAEAVNVIEDCGRARVAAAIVISAGFAEAGPEGRQLQEDLLAAARRFGVRILGPNCLGVINTDPDIRFRATFAGTVPRPGRVGLLSQSGTLGAVILDHASEAGLGISSFVAVGNKADLSGNDMLLYWLDDDRTDVVLLYLESFGNPRRFGRNVRQVAARKPVFAVRTGAVLDSLAAGEQAEGWLDDATIDALLRQTGVVRVPTVTSLLNAAIVAENQPVPTGNGVVVVGNSGGSASMAADACVNAGLRMVALSEETLAAIDARRLHGRRTTNPVDLAFDAAPEDYEAVLDAVLVDPDVDVALVVHAPYDPGAPDQVAAVLDRVAAQHPTSTIVSCIYGERTMVTDGGVPIFAFPDDAAYALGWLARYGVWRASELSGQVLACDTVEDVEALVGRLLAEDDRVELEPDAARGLLRAGGIDVVPVTVVRSPDELDALELDGPVALKAEAHHVGATTQRRGVALDLHDRDDVLAAAGTIIEGMGDDAWPMIVQPMVEAGTDVRISIGTHPVVGPVVRVGPGGGAGRFAPSPRRVLPLTDRGADELVTESGLDDVLDPDSRRHVVDLIRRLCAIVDAAPEVTELTCDPIIVRPDGADVIEVQATLAEVSVDDGTLVRRV
jgi:acyl-CoA synthetase (NDP forming)/RimJ/RimL family protein N-acetyltransferase